MRIKIVPATKRAVCGGSVKDASCLKGPENLVVRKRTLVARAGDNRRVLARDQPSTPNVPVAQLVEQRTENARVAGSNPARCTNTQIHPLRWHPGWVINVKRGSMP